jgi:hypothetical protein
MNPDELAAAGRALYGEQWQTSVSIDLNVADHGIGPRRARASELAPVDALDRDRDFVPPSGGRLEGLCREILCSPSLLRH